MQITLEQVIDRQEPIDCCGIKATRNGENSWIVWISEEYNDMEFDMNSSELRNLLNVSLGKRYRHCIAWHNCAGNGYACFKMCDEHQRNKCYEQQGKDKILESELQ